MTCPRHTVRELLRDDLSALRHTVRELLRDDLSALRLSADGKWLLDARDTTKPFRGKRGVRVYAVSGISVRTSVSVCSNFVYINIHFSILPIMNFHGLMNMVGHLPWFDLATLVQLTGERRESIVTQLHRLTKAGRVVPLRRGMYTLAEPYRRGRVQPAALANAIYRPSYLSSEWALSYHGLIPEATTVFTSVTSRVPRRFSNLFGEFRYRNVKEELFCGYQAVILSGERVLVATPEKAILDFFHLSRGEWSAERLGEMRFASISQTHRQGLGALAERLGSPRVRRTLSRLARVLDEHDEGVEL